MMSAYTDNKDAQQKVNYSAAVLSGQKLPDNFAGSTPQQGISLTKAWAREARDIIEFWQGYLSSDRDDPIDLIEINGVKISVQSLREGLTNYLFEGNCEALHLTPGKGSRNIGFSSSYVPTHFGLR
jgi:hypothetical protein